MDSLLQFSLQLVLLITLVLHSSSSEEVPNNATAPKAASLSCYQCNSDAMYHGPACDPEVIDNKFKQAFLKPCQPQDGQPYTRCRKMVQTVEGESRVIRSCATAGTGGDRCIDRVGTVRIKVKYCECQNSDPNTPCNSSPNQHLTLTSLALMTSFLCVVLKAVI